MTEQSSGLNSVSIGGVDVSGDYQGVVAIVTGGASGIGLAVTRLLTQRGATVASIDLAVSPPVDGAFCVNADVSDEDAIRHAVQSVAERTGGVDVVINNAGIGAVGSVEAGPAEEWSALWAVNVMGIVHTVRAALPYLRASDRAAVVNTGSIAAIAGIKERAAYSASKGAVHALTLAMAADFLSDGIRVNCVHPGTADTPWVERLLARNDRPDDERAALESRQPMGRLVAADEVAHAIAYLASPLSASTTGTALSVDGGMYGLR